MDDLVVHQTDITHHRLIALTKLADQAKPFYDWVEKQAKRITGSHKNLNEILLNCSQEEIEALIHACYSDTTAEKPFLFDGIGRIYPHTKACFYFFAWMIRDAPQQRLSPLISRMQKADDISRLTAETDCLAALIFEYRDLVRSFDWQVVREIVLDRLEGSRRSFAGHSIEASVRASLITALQYYYSVYGNYGKYRTVEIAKKQIKLGKHTVDVSADLIAREGGDRTRLLIPVKTRETEGGGHSHLFTRDIITAINDLKQEAHNYHIVAVVIAQNWSTSELSAMRDQVDRVFYFNMSPNKFVGFDEEAQIQLNRYIASILEEKND
ncbi:MAG: hypothetical protein U0768_08935 [Anaerolineae bacterium]